MPDPAGMYVDARERLLTAQRHREPDRGPLDPGSMRFTGIHAVAYGRWQRALGLPPAGVLLCDSIQRLAVPGSGFASGPVHIVPSKRPLENLLAPRAARYDFGVYS